MKFIQQKYWFYSLFVLLVFFACDNEQKSIDNTIKSTTEQTIAVDTSKKKLTTIIQDTTIIDSINTKEDSYIQQKKKKETYNKKRKNHTPVYPEPLAPVYTKMTEAKYWEWRKGRGCYNDSVGQREVIFNKLKYAYPNMDSITKEKKWQAHWDRYIKKKEKNNVIWDDSLRNIKNDPFFYKRKPYNPLIE